MTARARISLAVMAAVFALTAGVAQSRPGTSRGGGAAALAGPGTAGSDTISITTASALSDAIEGVPYSFQLAAAGGSGGYEWSLGGPPCPLPDCYPPYALPPGLSLSKSGLVQGTTTVTGDFRCVVVVRDSAGSSTAGDFTLHVRPSAAWAFSTWVPVASHAGGLDGSEWRTDAAILNTGSTAADIEVIFHGAGGIASETALIPAGAQVMLGDVVGQVGASGSGALEVLSDRPVKVSSRTYDRLLPDAACLPGGTEGQDFPGLDPANGLRAGEDAYRSATLPGLAENASFRSNIGLVNTGADAATVLVELYDGSQNKLAGYTIALQSGEWSQAVRPFEKLAGQTAMDSGYARITVQSGLGVFAFASVIDNVTSDPTTVSMQLSLFPSAGVSVAAHASGLNGSEWRTDVWVLNPANSVANAAVSFYGASGVASKAFSVPPETQLRLADVVAQLGASGSGQLVVGSDQPVKVTSRTYSQFLADAPCFPGGTEGQDDPALGPMGGLRDGETAYLPGLAENTSFRSNIGLLNTGANAAVVLVELVDGSGARLAEYTVPLEGRAWSQAVQPFRKLAGQSLLAGGYARITVLSGSGIVAFASVIDNLTNDPTTVSMQR